MRSDLQYTANIQSGKVNLYRFALPSEQGRAAFLHMIEYPCSVDSILITEGSDVPSFLATLPIQGDIESDRSCVD